MAEVKPYTVLVKGDTKLVVCLVDAESRGEAIQHIEAKLCADHTGDTAIWAYEGHLEVVVRDRDT